MIQYWIMPIYSLSFFVTIIFQNSTHVIYVKDSIRWCSWKSVQIENTWVRSTQNRNGIVRHGDSSEDIDAQLSENFKRWCREVKIRNSDYETLTPGTENRNTDSGQESRKGLSGVEGGKGKCYQWKEKGQCSKGDQCSFWHESNDRAQKLTPKAATPSEPSMSRGRSVSRKRSVRGKSNPVMISRQPSKYLYEITLWVWAFSRVSILINRIGCKARDKCLFPHHKVDEQTNKEPKKELPSPPKEEKAKTQLLSLLWKLYHSWVESRKTQIIGISKRRRVSEKPDATSFGTNFDKYDSPSLRYVKQVSGKKRPSLGKIQLKMPHQRSTHAMKFEDTSQEETERQQRCARGKAWNLAKNKNKLKEKDKATFYSPSEEGVLLAASTKEPEEREFVVDSGASMHIVSKKDLNSAELETMRMSRNPTTVMTANGEVQTREDATKYIKELDLFVTVMLLEETPTVLSLGKLCEDHGYIYHWTGGQKPHLTQKGKTINWQLTKVRNKNEVIAEARVIDGPLSSQEFGIGTTNSKIQRSGRPARRHCEGCFRIVCCVHWGGIISITIDSRMSHGHYFKITGMRRTSSRCSVSFHQGQNGRCTNVIEKFKVRVPGFLDTCTEAQMAKIMVQYGRSSRSCWTKSARSPFGSTVMEKAISRNICLNTVGEKFQIGNVYSLTEKKVCSCLCTWMT